MGGDNDMASHIYEQNTIIIFCRVLCSQITSRLTDVAIAEQKDTTMCYCHLLEFSPKNMNSEIMSNKQSRHSFTLEPLSFSFSLLYSLFFSNIPAR